MGRVNLDRVRHLSGSLAEGEQCFHQLGQLSEAEFLAEFRNTESAKYLFVVAVEAAVDLCNHLVSKQGNRPPKDYADCFQVLAEMGVISNEFARRLAQMARSCDFPLHISRKGDNQA